MAQNTVEIILKATDQMSPVVKKGAGSFDDMTRSLAKMAIGAVSITAVTAFVGDMINVAKESQTVMAATEAVIKSTGGAAGMTARQIEQLAQSESLLTGIDDEVVQSGANMLLTFRNIGEDVFPRAQRAMEDMAAAMAGGDISALDLKGTAIQLGKALNDPILGVQALRRVGVTLSEQQKQQIKDFMAVSDVASAQKVILAELEAEFGGMAEAMGNTDAGKIQKAQNAIENLKEAIGSQLLPVLGQAAEAATTLLTWNERLGSIYLEHEKDVKRTSASYKDYAAEMKRAAEAAGFQVNAEGDLVQVLVSQLGIRENVIEKNAVLSESEWELRNATDARKKSLEELVPTEEELAAAEEAIKESMKELSTFMADDLGKENAKFLESQKQIAESIADLNAELKNLSTNSVFKDFNDQLRDLYDSYVKSLRGINERIDDENQNFADDEYDRQAKLQDDTTDIINKYNDKKLNLAEDLSEEERNAQMKILDQQQREELDKITAQYDLKESRAVRDHEKKIARLQRDLEDEDIEYQKSQAKINQRINEAAENQKQKIEEIKAKIAELNQKYADSAEEHKKASDKIVFDLLSQQLALDGLTKQESETLIQTAKDWGLVGDDTFAAWQKMQDYISSMGSAQLNAEDLRRVVENIPSDKDIKLHVAWDLASLEAAGILPQYYNPTGYAEGADFTVPPGFSNDTFPMRVSSGEHVTVTPKGEGISVDELVNKLIAAISRRPTYLINANYGGGDRQMSNDLRLLQMLGKIT